MCSMQKCDLVTFLFGPSYICKHYEAWPDFLKSYLNANEKLGKLKSKLNKEGIIFLINFIKSLKPKYLVLPTSWQVHEKYYEAHDGPEYLQFQNWIQCPRFPWAFHS